MPGGFSAFSEMAIRKRKRIALSRIGRIDHHSPAHRIDKGDAPFNSSISGRLAFPPDRLAHLAAFCSKIFQNTRCYSTVFEQKPQQHMFGTNLLLVQRSSFFLGKVDRRATSRSAGKSPALSLQSANSTNSTNSNKFLYFGANQFGIEP